MLYRLYVAPKEIPYHYRAHILADRRGEQNRWSLLSIIKLVSFAP